MIMEINRNAYSDAVNGMLMPLDELTYLNPEKDYYRNPSFEPEYGKIVLEDMLLEAGRFRDCYSSGKADEVEAIRNATAPSSVFVDWQYGCTEVPIPSLESLKDCGHDCVGAPWDQPGNYAAHIETVVQNNLYGIMLTTWHTLKHRMASIPDCAMKLGAQSFVWSNSSAWRRCAVLLPEEPM